MFIFMVHPDNAYLYYFAVIARSIEGDESDAAIPGGAAKKITASAVALRAMAGQAR
ncbi:MAG: hypothetical protein GXP52_08255 [Deltaproteobacteria bacterium]|nr:hypothetical protein [Deltaproteobacteria bacterium]